MNGSPPDLRGRVRRLMAHPTTDHTVIALILFSVALLFVEIIDPIEFIYFEIGYVINCLFLVELFLRYYGSFSRRRFFSAYWLDILSLMPLFWPSYGFLRALRILRIFRLGPLLRQSSRRFGVIFRRTMREQITILSIVSVVVVGVTLGMVGSEREFAHLDDAFWWAILSVMAGEPVGITPETPLGRFFSLVVIFGGITIFALFTGTVSAIITEKLRTGVMASMISPDELEDHIVICGWNRSLRTLLDELLALPRDEVRAIVVVAENPPEFTPEQEANPHVHFVRGDYTTLQALHAACVQRAAKAILLADRSVSGRSDQDRDARTILAGLMIEKIRPGIFTCAELLSRENEQHLRLAGIEEVVVGDEYSATILATSTRVGGVTNIADEIFSSQFGNQFFKEPVPESWVGLTFLELQKRVKECNDALLIAVEQSTNEDRSSSDGGLAPYQRTITNPPASYTFKRGDRVIIVARVRPTW